MNECIYIFKYENNMLLVKYMIYYAGILRYIRYYTIGLGLGN